jgi:Cof subfamily protein (haloacid dehalogenase superfamily)
VADPSAVRPDPGGSPRPRLVATDLDGTLLHSDGTVTERTRGVLDALDAQGVTVVFVTGRPIRWMDDLWHHVGDHGLAVCSNGGIVYDVPGRAVREARTIPRAVGLRVADLVRTALPGSTFALEKTTGFGKEAAFLPQPEDAERPELEVGPLERVFDDRVVKMLALHPELAPEDYWARVEQLVGDAVTTTWSSTGALVEMSAAGVTKASTLARLCAELGVAAEEVVAFGDMPNDVAMLEWAGTAYAMANGHPSAIAAAGRTAPANDEDGVARVLEELLLR